MRVQYIEKVWGRTACVVKKPGFTVHHLVVVPGSFCSIHLHDHRSNGFFVTQGLMTVQEFGPDGTIHQVDLGPGDYYEVAPGIRHQFRTLEGCEALEVYFPPDVDDGDIIRFSIGGLIGQ